MFDSIDELSVKSTECIWLTIRGKPEQIQEIMKFLEECPPNYNISGSSGPWFINMAFSKENADRVLTKLKEMKG